MLEIQAMQRFLYGFDLDQVKSIILIPLSSIFENILNTFGGATCKNGGIYKSFIIDKVLVVKCPQGIQAQDAIIPIKNKRILLVGFAGGFENALLGQVVSIEETCLPNGERIQIKSADHLQACICGYSPALLGDLAKFYQDLSKKNGCNVVDMEIAYCSKIAALNNNVFSAIVLITDLPGQIELWEKDKVNQEAIKDGYNRLCTFVGTHINEVNAK